MSGPRAWSRFAAVSLVCVACDATSFSGGDGEGRGLPGVGGTATAGPAGSGGTTATPPELDLEDDFRAPITTGKYVWSANPQTSRVALIDAETFETSAVEAGFEPTYLAALPSPGQDVNRALVLNVRSSDATLLSVDDDAEITSRSVAVHEGANAWAVRDDGRYAIAWSNVRFIDGATTAQGFQDVTVLKIDGDDVTPTRLTVGYRPSQIRFSSDGDTAFAVTQSGVSVIALSDEPEVTGLVLLSDDPVADPTALSVVITPDGGYALVRTEGSAHITFVELETGEISGLDLAAPVTDLEVSADGSLAMAVVRDRPFVDVDGDAGAPPAESTPDASIEAEEELTDGGVDGGMASGGSGTGGSGGGVGGSAAETPPPVSTRSEIAFLPLPDVFEDPDAARVIPVEGPRAGSVAITPNGEQAVLYLTAQASSSVTVVSRDGAFRAIDLRATVQAVFPSDDGKNAVVLQVEPNNASRPGAFSVVPLEGNRAPRIEATVAPPHSIALLPSTSERASDRALITVSTGASATPGRHAVYLADTDKLGVESYDLSAEPLATGIVPVVGRGMVAQKHPEGLISFFDLDGGARREITGFELASRVVNE